MSKKPFHLILAMAKNHGIGFKGQLPWPMIKKDMLHFKNITTNTKLFKQIDVKPKNAVIMGRKTFDSFQNQYKYLPDRINIVLSNTLTKDKLICKSSSCYDFSKKFGLRENLFVCNSLDNSLQMIQSELQNEVENVFVIGGSTIFDEARHHDQCSNLFLTRINQNFECDVFAPKNLTENFIHLETSKTFSQKKNNIAFDFQRFVNKKNFQPSDFQQKILPYESHQEFQYLNMLKDIIETGNVKSDRTNTGTRSKFGGMMRFDLENSFPLLTTKDVYWKGVVEELLWFIKGCTNSKILSEKKVKIWDANGSRQFLDNLGLKHREEGDLGPVYGFQWRHFGAKYENMHSDYSNQGVDQLKGLIHDIKTNPNSRRLIISAWNPVDLPIMALPPCHVMSQFYVADNKLSCILYQRSCDMGLGVPFNIASYALLTCMIAQVCGLQRGEFVHMLGDSHVYLNHIEQLKQQISRIPNHFPLLKIKRDIKDIEDFKYKDFELIGYNPQGKIKMDMAV